MNTTTLFQVVPLHSVARSANAITVALCTIGESDPARYHVFFPLAFREQDHSFTCPTEAAVYAVNCAMNTPPRLTLEPEHVIASLLFSSFSAAPLDDLNRIASDFLQFKAGTYQDEIRTWFFSYFKAFKSFPSGR